MSNPMPTIFENVRHTQPLYFSGPRRLSV
jgi:hypothetical protein